MELLPDLGDLGDFGDLELLPDFGVFGDLGDPLFPDPLLLRANRWRGSGSSTSKEFSA